MGRARQFFKTAFGSKKAKRELRSIVMEMYGGNALAFAKHYASNIYSIPEVRTAIETFADIFSTIPRYFKRENKDGHVEYYENAASRVINLKPNKLQNATQFWKNAISSLMLYSNVFIEPTYNSKSGELEQLYVLPHDRFDFKLYEERATVTFLSLGKTYDLDDLIYLNRFPTLSGGQKNDLGLYETVIQALANQAINVADPKKVRAILQAGVGTQGNLKDRDKDGVLKDLQGNFDKAVNGIVYFDSQWNVTPINWTENDVNRELMRFIVNIVDNYFGMTEEIINGKATEIEYQLFVKNKMEPLARQIEQEFTYKIFSKREIEFGNKLELDTFYLSVSTLAAKTQFFSVAGRGGIMNADEMREMIGQPPLPNGLGKVYRASADTVNIEIVDEYQKAKNGDVGGGQAGDPKPVATEPKGGNDGSGQTQNSKELSSDET
ncbi:MAG: phage portal protein [Clostridia bacterium]|nr:phage portal protein [Clostridia bacterium]